MVKAKIIARHERGDWAWATSNAYNGKEGGKVGQAQTCIGWKECAVSWWWWWWFSGRPGSGGKGATRPGSAGKGASGAIGSSSSRPATSVIRPTRPGSGGLRPTRTESTIGIRHMRIGSDSSCSAARSNPDDNTHSNPDDPLRSHPDGRKPEPDPNPKSDNDDGYPGAGEKTRGHTLLASQTGLKPRPITLTPTGVYALRALSGRPVTPRGGAFEIPLAAGGEIEGRGEERAAHSDGGAAQLGTSVQGGYRNRDEPSMNCQDDRTGPAGERWVESHKEPSRGGPTPHAHALLSFESFRSGLGDSATTPAQSSVGSWNSTRPSRVGASFSALGEHPEEHLSTTPEDPTNRFGTPRRPRTSTGAENRSRRGLEIDRSRTSSSLLGTTEPSMAMGFVSRPGATRSMTFPRAAMSDVELRSEWSSSESGSIKGKFSTLRSRKSPRRTMESERPGRMTVESERRRMTEDSDRPSVDQRRFGSLLRVRVPSNASQYEVEAYSDSEHTRRGKPKRSSWLAGLGFRSRGPSPEPSGSRAPSPSSVSVPSLARIPSLSPINSPFAPTFQVLPATPLGKMNFEGCVGEGAVGLGAEWNRTLYDEPVSQVTGTSVRPRGDLTEHEPRMLSRGSSLTKAPPPRPPPSRPVPATPEFILPDDRRQREATIRPSSRSRPPSATELGLNGDHGLVFSPNSFPFMLTIPQDKHSFLDQLDVQDDDEHVYYGEDIPPGTATTSDEPRIAVGGHRSQLSMSSRVPVTENNIRWSASGRSRSNSLNSASQWRTVSVYQDSDEEVYGLPSPMVNVPDPDGMMSHGEYGGIVGPRRDLYSDDELESVLEENETESVSDEHDREDRTAAMIVADEGRGLIVDAEGRPVSDLDVQTGTTHLLLGSSPTPALLPAFLAQVLPQISTSLLCLDISNNELIALPPALTSCTNLEELNVSSNPLRTLPSSLGALVSLRVLIADACELQSLPSQLVNLGALHSLSVRCNRLVMLPVWFCAMPGLEVLKIEGNTFAGPWRSLVEPLLPRDTSYTPPPPTNGVYGAARAANSLPLLSTTVNGSGSLASPVLLNRPATSQRSYSQQPQSSSALDPRWSGHAFTTSPLSSPYPTSSSAPHSPPRSALSPPPAHALMSPPPATGLAHLQLPVHSPPSTAAKLNMHLGALAPSPRKKKKRGGGSISGSEIVTTDAESEVEATTSWASGPRRMKSADELRKMGNTDDQGPPPSAPILSTAPTLPEPQQQQGQVKRYMSLGVRSSPSRPDARQMWAGGSARNSTIGSGSRNSTGGPRNSRYSATGIQGQKLEEDQASPDVSYEFGALGGGMGVGAGGGSEEDGRPSIARAASDERVGQRYSGTDDPYAHGKTNGAGTAGASQEDQRRKGRWGFFKKVSMGRLRSHSNAERLGRLPAAQAGDMPAMPTRPQQPQSQSQSQSQSPSQSQPIAAPPVPVPPQVNVTSAGSPASSVLTARVLASRRSQEALHGAPSPGLLQPVPSPSLPRAKRRSFLPFDTPPLLNIPIPAEPFMPSVVALDEPENENEHENEDEALAAAEEAQRRADEEAARQHLALRGIMSYLRDMADLEGGLGSGLVPSPRNSRRPPLTQYMDGRTKSDGSYASSTSTPPMLRSAPSTASLRGGQDSVNTTDSSGSYGQFAEDRKYKDDKGRRVAIVREIVETEKSYVKGLQELVDIYVKPASEPAPGLNVGKETTIPSAERKIVFTGLDALLQFHKQSFLPSLINAAEILSTAGPGEDVSTRTAHAIANVFVSHAAFMKMYFTYINNFDNAIQRLQFWSAPPSAPNTPGTATPASNTPSTVGAGLSMVAVGIAGVSPEQAPHPATLNAGQRKRIKQFLKRCRLHPRHSQLNLEGYLLLPIQRIPRYKMLLDNLVTCTPPHPESRDDPLERALEEIAVLANSMNEGKRESESRTKLVQWQTRIKGKFISPLVQPHRRLIMDGRLQLVRLVKKVNSRADVPNPDGTIGQVEVPCLSSDANPKQLVAILCNDLLVLCKELPGAEMVELWAVLRMQTMAQPASIVNGNGLRIVDNKAILYFNTQSTSEALTWQRAINLHIPHSQ
ncbi:hypothetical protein RhiTH_005615 [Rhizoctonia solani]